MCSQHRSPPSANIRLNGQIDTGPVGQQWPRLQTLYEVSRFEFINVSTVIIDAHEHGVPGAGPQLAVFGSGRYRSSDVYLVVKPVAKLEEPGGFLFYAGGLSRPQWSRSEDSAVL